MLFFFQQNFFETKEEKKKKKAKIDGGQRKKERKNLTFPIIFCTVGLGIIWAAIFKDISLFFTFQKEYINTYIR